MPNLFIYIQALFIFLTSATAVPFFGFRLSDIALICFFVTLIFSFPRKYFLSLRLFIFLLLILVAIYFSTVFSVLILGGNFEDGAANAVAVPFGIFTSLICAWLITPSYLSRLVVVYSKVSILLCLVLFIYIAQYGTPSWIIYTEEFDRYSALAQNPNQLALYLLPIPFFLLAGYSKKLIGIRLMLLLNALVFGINAYMLGKALFIAWTLSFSILFLSGSICGPLRGTLKIILLKIAILIFAAISSLPLINALYTGESPGSQADQGDIRITLWKHGLDAWFNSIFFGNGPGHFSGIERPFQNMESHNLLVDWLSAYGLVGGITLILYFIWLFKYSFRQQTWVVSAMYIALLVQSTFHFYGRQPFFWMLLVFGHMIASSFMNARRFT